MVSLKFFPWWPLLPWQPNILIPRQNWLQHILQSYVRAIWVNTRTVKQGVPMWQMIDHTMEKCVGIGGIACTARTTPPKNPLVPKSKKNTDWQRMDNTDLQRDEHREKFSLIADEHTVTDTGQLFTHRILYQYWRHILSTSGDYQLCNIKSSFLCLQASAK